MPGDRLSDNDVSRKTQANPKLLTGKSIEAANDEGISFEDQGPASCYKKLRPGEPPVVEWWPAASAQPFLRFQALRPGRSAVLQRSTKSCADDPEIGGAKPLTSEDGASPHDWIT